MASLKALRDSILKYEALSGGTKNVELRRRFNALLLSGGNWSCSMEDSTGAGEGCVFHRKKNGEHQYLIRFTDPGMDPIDYYREEDAKSDENVLLMWSAVEDGKWVVRTKWTDDGKYDEANDKTGKMEAFKRPNLAPSNPQNWKMN